MCFVWLLGGLVSHWNGWVTKFSSFEHSSGSVVPFYALFLSCVVVPIMIKTVRNVKEIVLLYFSVILLFRFVFCMNNKMRNLGLKDFLRDFL